MGSVGNKSVEVELSTLGRAYSERENTKFSATSRLQFNDFRNAAYKAVKESGSSYKDIILDIEGKTYNKNYWSSFGSNNLADLQSQIDKFVSNTKTKSETALQSSERENLLKTAYVMQHSLNVHKKKNEQKIVSKYYM